MPAALRTLGRGSSETRQDDPHDGAPLAYQRFIARHAGGETAGVTDGDGRAELLLEGEATIVFPDIPTVEKP